MWRLDDHFEIPFEQVADATRDIRQQRALLQELVSTGEPTGRAEDALKTMLMTLGAVREQNSYIARGGRLH